MFFCIKGSGKGSYRTFKTQRIQGLILYNYKFPADIDHFNQDELDVNEN